MHITVSHTISMGHRLPSYDGICNSLHGHNIRVEVSVLPGLHFLDFKDVGKGLKQILEPLDHAMVLCCSDPIGVLIQANLPEQRIVWLNVEPTTEALAAYIWRELGLLTFRVESVTVHETDKYSATVCKERETEIPLVTWMVECEDRRVSKDVMPHTYQENSSRRTGCELCGQAAEHSIHETERRATRTRAGDQPLPTPDDSPAMQDLVIADIEARKKVGIERYGQTLKAWDGRDNLMDAYQEVMDLTIYLRKEIYRRDGK